MCVFASNYNSKTLSFQMKLSEQKDISLSTTKKIYGGKLIFFDI